MRQGKRGTPYYRIVAVDHRKRRDGAYLDKIGTYNPLTSPAALEVDEKKLQEWLAKGAMVSEGMTKLLGKKIREIKNSLKRD